MVKSLIIYFSREGENYVNGDLKNLEKGNTEIIVDYIKEFIEADAFKVETKNPYPESYMETTEIAKKELKNKICPELKNLLFDISKYDTIYIASPVWWETLPRAMFTQLKNLDFENKTVKLVVTHEGSMLGNVMKDIKKLCKGADIKEGLSIKGSEVANAKYEVKNWLYY